MNGNNTAIEKADQQIVPKRIHLFATDAEGMKTAGSELAEWLGKKVEQERDDLQKLEDNLAIAKRNRWRSYTLSAAVNKARKSVAYYVKLRAAVEAGYCPIPDVGWTDWFAIRTEREPDERYREERRPDPKVYDSEAPKIGQGKYVSPEAEFSTGTPVNDEKGNKLIPAWNTGWKDVLFPLTMVRPEVMDQTSKAMALKVFDRIGIVGGRRKDPLIIGEIRGPKRRTRLVIAWFLDTNTL